jgi:ribose/xylose/arabinose/galactoside ABC-type transport system permease subunit
MDKILYFINDLSIAFILSLPLYLLQFQLENQEQMPYNKMLANVLKLPMTVSIWIGLIFLRDGSSVWSYLFIIIVMNLSIYFRFYQFINYFKKGDKKSKEKDSILGLSKRQFMKLGVPALIAIVLIISVGAMSGKKVMGYHHEIINQLEKEENKIEYLIYHAENPGSVIDELQYLY